MHRILTARWTAALVVPLSVACGDGERADAPPVASLRQDCDPNIKGTRCVYPVRDLCHDPTKREPKQLFDWSHVPRFDLWVSKENWEGMLADPTAEQYVTAKLDFEDERVGRIGLRFKGDHGTLDLCVDADGQWLCPKLSMKLGFTLVDASCRFFGIRHLNLHSMQWDPTWLHERIAYDLYREFGVFAPRSAWAMVSINGESFGLYSMVEDIDGSFVEDRWGDDDDGELYKEAWPKTDDPEYYRALLASNSTSARPEQFAQHYRALADVEDEPTALATALGRWTSLDYLHRYLAVDDAIINWDGITTTYIAVDDSWSRNHNYYWYRDTNRDRFWLIPWDLDGTLVPTKAVVNAPHWTVTPVDCSTKYAEFGADIWVLAPGCDRFFRALAADTTVYRQTIDRLLDGALSESSWRNRIAVHRDFLAEAIAEDPTVDATGWHDAVTTLMDSIPLLRERLTRLRDGQSIQPLRLQTGGRNDFSAVSSFEVAIGVNQYSNVASTTQISLQSPTDLDPTPTRIRMDFSMRNEAEPWKQWVKMAYDLAGGPNDLSNKIGLRMRLRADKPRVLRVEIRSPNQSRTHDGVQLGWDAAALDSWNLLELRFSEAGLTTWAIERGLDPGDPPATVWSTVTGLELLPSGLGRNSNGQLPPEKVDHGFLEIDYIEFF